MDPLIRAAVREWTDEGARLVKVEQLEFDGEITPGFEALFNGDQKQWDREKWDWVMKLVVDALRDKPEYPYLSWILPTTPQDLVHYQIGGACACTSESPPRRHRCVTWVVVGPLPRFPLLLKPGECEDGGVVD